VDALSIITLTASAFSVVAAIATLRLHARHRRNRLEHERAMANIRRLQTQIDELRRRRQEN
jgi:uncharacterized membrane protein YciS (DUF1049 family)